MERTFIAIKPDGVKRGLIGNIIRRIEHKGYKIIGIKMLHPTLEIAEKHYAEHKGKPFYQSLIDYITSGPIVAMVVEGKNVIEGMRHMMGATVPNDAQVGTIRADLHKQKNVIQFMALIAAKVQKEKLIFTLKKKNFVKIGKQ